MSTYELNLDGLVGSTHHFAGLSMDNVASITYAGISADPAAAALQGLQKMRFLSHLGIKQAVIPPHFRPNLALLHQLGFQGSPAQQITRALKKAPALLSAAFSASSMWAANTATVSASEDCPDHKIHFTPANLISNLHRHQEASFSEIFLKKIFAQERYFQHHAPLPSSLVTADEGAANHMRLCQSHAQRGVNLFVHGYGKGALSSPDKRKKTLNYPPRQRYEASSAIARAHGLDPSRVLFAEQNPRAINEGVFHNDVIAVANESLLLLHQEAYCNQESFYQELQAKLDFSLTIIEVKTTQLSLKEAVSTYLFNSQVLTREGHGMLLLCPQECAENRKVKNLVEELVADPNNPISEVHYLDLKQSMQNGGGPACLRLRIPLKEVELNAMHQAVLINDTLLDNLEAWVKKHYRSQLRVADLADPQLIEESLVALDSLSALLQLGSIYPFQQEKI